MLLQRDNPRHQLIPRQALQVLVAPLLFEQLWRAQQRVQHAVTTVAVLATLAAAILGHCETLKLYELINFMRWGDVVARWLIGSDPDY